MRGDLLKKVGGEAFETPAAAARALERIEELDSQSKPFNAMELKDEFNETFWWGTEGGSSEAEEQEQQRVRAIGWALQELAVWAPENTRAYHRLQIVLTTLLMSSESDREAMEAASQELACPSLLDGLVMLLKVTSIGIHSHRLGEHQWREEAQAAGRCGDYSKLGNLIRHLETELSPDVRLAVMLLRKFAPDRLARYIEERQDVFFSVAVQGVLADEAPKFAQSVNDVTFKFVCASKLAAIRAADAPEGAVDAVCELLLQVAQTDRWHSWLDDFARYPQVETVAEKALSKVLAQLTPVHWHAFVDAVELWTHERTAISVATILVPFLHTLGAETSADMWRFAFERWDKWDYGREERDKHLHAPSACSFDFPVAMHYALLRLDEAQAEEIRLLERIGTVEQKWFSDFSELLTYRNRLSSRLRLVQHGLAIRNSPAEGSYPLPPCIEPDSEFAEVRYRFFDVNAPRARGR